MDVSPSPAASSEFLEKMRQQFDFGPYPRTPIEESPSEDPDRLFIHNLVTPYYLHHRKVINTEGALILDAGCGTGYKALSLAMANPGAHVVGIDISPKSIELAQQRIEFHKFQDRVEFKVLAIEELASLGMQFDYINCDEVLYFFDDIAEGLAAMGAVLKPQGIIRANLHSAFQRAIYFRAQELFKLMGLMEDDSDELAMAIVVETMKALLPGVDLRQRAWQPSYEDEENNKELLLANHLLKGDRGYRIADLFDGLRRANLAFINMVNWRHWDVADLFVDPDDLPTYFAMGLADSDQEAKLTLYELLNPVHRLLDFWCTPAEAGEPAETLDNWQLEDWAGTQIHLHPQLQTDKFRTAMVAAIAQNKPTLVSEHLSLPAFKPVPVETNVAALLVKLWDGPLSFEDLTAFWQQTHPFDLVTLEPTTITTAQQQVADALSKMEAFLYVMVESA